MLTLVVVRGAFIPIALAPASFNQDIVVERSSPPPLMPVTTASMDAGVVNDGYAFYERGYHLESRATGLPAAGSVILSDISTDHAFQFAPTYTTNNALLVDSNTVSAAFVLETPAAFTALAFLSAGGNGGGNVGFTIHHLDGTTQSSTLPCPNWTSLGVPAFTAAGRVHVRAFTFAGVNGSYPKLFSTDITLSNALSPVVSVGINYLTGEGHNAIFALSGATAAGAGFDPVAVRGYNHDLVVEATAPHPDFLIGVTTATMDDGAVNTRTTWFEQGYFPGDLTVGLVPAGSLIAALNGPDHQYVLPASFTANNACMVDPGSNASLVPANPTTCSALSFLTASGNGPVTLRCVAQHADGTGETNSFVAPDWNSGGSDAFHANGRVSINTRLVTASSGSPSLYAADVALTNTSSPVTNVWLGYKSGGGPGAHAFVLALSGAPLGAERPALSIRVDDQGGLVLGTSAPGRLQSTAMLNGTNTVWQEEGALEKEVQVTPRAGEQMRFYRLAP